MEMHQIRYFLAACRTLNFTRAAEECNVSQPALTRAVRLLEEEFGAPLFIRERRRTQLTPMGKLLRDHLSIIDDQAQTMKLAARQLLDLDQAELDVGVMCTISPARFAPFLAAFGAEHPGIACKVHDLTPTGLAEDLLSGKLDCALVARAGALHERMDAVPLYDERMVLAFGPEHPFAQRNGVQLKEIAGERYVDRLNCEFRSLFLDFFDQQALDLEIAYSSEREDWVQHMVRAGLGVCLLPEDAVMVDGIKCCAVLEPELKRAVELVTLAGRPFAPGLRQFIDFATGYDWTGGRRPAKRPNRSASKP
jgi:LysR family hydrogen peroxide-inducible transcriptional activator